MTMQSDAAHHEVKSMLTAMPTALHRHRLQALFKILQQHHQSKRRLGQATIRYRVLTSLVTEGHVAFSKRRDWSAHSRSDS